MINHKIELMCCCVKFNTSYFKLMTRFTLAQETRYKGAKIGLSEILSVRVRRPNLNTPIK